MRSEKIEPAKSANSDSRGDRRDDKGTGEIPMTHLIQRIVAEHGVLVLMQYVLMIPLVVTAVLAGRRAVGNVLRHVSA